MKKIFFYSLVLISSIFFISCTSLTTLYDNQANDNFKGKKLNKVAVLVQDHKENTYVIEKKIVYTLKDYGIEAYPADEIIPSDLLNPPRDIEQYEWRISKLQFQLNNSGIDAIFIVYLAGEIESVNLKNLIFNYDYIGYPNRESGNAEYSTKVYFITNLCDVKTGDVIWSAKSETVNPYSTSDLAKSYVTAIMDDLHNEGIVK